MREVVIFVPLIQLMRECKLASQAGFFCSLQKVSIPIKRRSAFNTERLRNVSLAQATVLAAVTGGPLFFSAYANTVHNVHLRTLPTPAQNPSHSQTDRSCKQPGIGAYRTVKETGLNSSFHTNTNYLPGAGLNRRVMNISYSGIIKSGRVPEANIQAEFYLLCRKHKIPVLLEVKYMNCRFDAVIFCNDRPCAIVEVKNFTEKTAKRGLKKNGRQYRNYTKFGIPLIQLLNSKQILKAFDDVLEIYNKEISQNDKY